MGMTPTDLKARTKKFAVDVLRFARTSISHGPFELQIASQLTDAAGATGSGYRAVCRARTRADFVYKLGNTIEEVDEAAFWLEVLMESDIVPAAKARPLWQEADELTRILVRSRETARKPR
jgi:four helix bundle protein